MYQGISIKINYSEAHILNSSNRLRLFDPANKEILKRLKESLQQEASFDLGSFKKCVAKKVMKSDIFD